MYKVVCVCVYDCLFLCICILQDLSYSSVGVGTHVHACMCACVGGCLLKDYVHFIYIHYDSSKAIQKLKRSHDSSIKVSLYSDEK